MPARVPLYNGGNFTPAPQGVRVPMPAQLDAGQGQAAWGQALGKLSQTFEVMAQKQAEATDTRQLIEAEGLMRKSSMDFQQWQQTADESEWLPKWQEKQKELQETFKGMKLTDNARLRLDQTFGRWGDSQAIEIQGAAFRRSVGRAKQAVINRADEAAAAGDSAGVQSALSLLPQDYTTPEEREAIRINLDQKARAVGRQQDQMAAETIIKNKGLAGVQEANAIYDASPHWSAAEKANLKAGTERAADFENLKVIARDDPRRAAELATAMEKEGKLTGPERVQVMDISERQLDQNRSDKLKNYAAEIQNGIPDKEAFAAKVLDDTDLTPGDKAELGRFLDAGPVNDPVVYQTLFNEAKTFQYDEGSPEYARFLARVDMTQKEGNKSSILAQLDQTVKGPKDGQTRAFNEVYSMVSEDLKAGVFGDLQGHLDDPQTMPPAAIRDQIRTVRNNLIEDAGAAEQERLKKEPSRMDYWERRAREQWWSSRPDKGDSFTAYSVDDEAKKRAASNIAFQITASLDKWRNDNPKATPEQFKAEAERLTAQYRAASGMKTGFVNPLLDGTQVPTKEQIDAEIAKFRKK